MLSSPYLYSLALFLSLSLIFLFLAPQILPLKHPPTISLADDLDDLALFHNATIAASTSSHSAAATKISHLSFSNHPKPKIAFLFLTNSDLVFAPLWDSFFSGNENLFNIYVHADPSIDLNKNPPHKLFQNRFIPAKRTERASPTLISAARRLLANALLDDPLNLYFALLSQTCIPLHSFQYIYHSILGNSTWKLFNSFATQSKHQSFIEILSEDPNLQRRYDARGENVMLPEVRFEDFRVGSQFFILAKRHALLVINEKKLWRKFRLPCLNLNSCYPEEHYFPTLLSMEDPSGCSHYSMTRVNWTESVDGHPHTYRPAEVSPELIYTLRESNSSYSYFFARKFSPDCLKPLMDIAPDVIFRD